MSTIMITIMMSTIMMSTIRLKSWLSSWYIIHWHRSPQKPPGPSFDNIWPKLPRYIIHLRPGGHRGVVVAVVFGV